MNEMTNNECEAVSGGLTGVELTILFAVGGYIVTNWSDAKRGFADGFVTGYNGVRK